MWRKRGGEAQSCEQRGVRNVNADRKRAEDVDNLDENGTKVNLYAMEMILSAISGSVDAEVRKSERAVQLRVRESEYVLDGAVSRCEVYPITLAKS